jgi:hypothetical protein
MAVISTSAGWIFGLGLESSFNGSQGAWLGTLGQGAKITTLTLKTDPERVYNVGSNYTQLMYTKGFEVDFTIEFYLSNDAFKPLVTPTNGTLASAYCLIQTPDNGAVWEITGIVFESMSLDLTTGDAAKVTLSGKGSRFIPNASQTVSLSIPSGMITWNQASLSLGNSASQPIQKVSLDVSTDPEMFRTLGNIEYVAFVPRKYSVKLEAEILHDSGLLEGIESSAQGGILTTQTASLTMGGITFNITGLASSEGGLTIEPVNPVIDKVTMEGMSLTF